MNGGKEINKVPDTCTITFDFRTIKKEHNDIIIKEIEKLVKKYQASSTIMNNLNAAVTANQEIIEKLEKLTKKKVTGLNYVTEASLFPDKNVIILGPGPITAHQKDETIEKESYVKCQKLYMEIMQSI